MSDNKGGRPPLTDEQKEYDKLLKNSLSKLKNSSRKNEKAKQEFLAANEIIYYFNKYGLETSEAAKKASGDPNISGFARAVLGMYKKSFEGDMQAFKMMLKMAGLDVDRLDITTNGDKNIFQLKYKLEDD